MTTSLSSSLVRLLACGALVVICLGLISPAVAAGPVLVQNGHAGPQIWLQDSQLLPASYVSAAGDAAAAPAPDVRAAMQGAQPVAMAQGDFDQDGVADLAVGLSAGGSGFIAIHRGNLDAFAPQSEASFQAIGRGEFPAPFLPEAKVFSVPVSPDFMVAGNFMGKGNIDLVVAARGGNALYILAGDGKGNFAAPQPINLSGAITALASGDLGNGQPASNLIVGFSNNKQFFLAIYGGAQQGPAPLAIYGLSAPVTSIALGDLDGDSHPDFAVLAGGQVLIYHGATAQLQPVSLPFNVSALALGSFIFDRDSREQMALLSSDGSIHIAAHSSFDPHAFTQAEWQQMRQATVNGLPNPLVPAPVIGESWKIVESLNSVAPFTGGQLPVLFRTRISGNAADDVMVLNGGVGQLALVTHSNLAEGAATFLPGQLSMRPYSGSPVAALPLRVNIDARPGVVALHQGETAPRFMGPLPDPTFTVNTTSDIINTGATPCASATAGQCSLRQAIFEANAVAGVDTIMVPAGTYTLTIADGGTDAHNATAGELSITDGVNIVGAVGGSGNPTTIIQACSVNPGTAVGSTCAGAGGTGITEKPFSVNPNFNKAFDTSFSNLEIRFGHNTGTFGTDGFGGGFDWEASKTGTMTVTNCNIHDNAIEDGRGAGITATNTGGGTGHFTMSNSTVSHNVAQRKLTNSGTGGGIFFGTATQFSITNSHIDNNQAVNGNSEGGGIFIFNPGTTPISVIHGGTISGNTALIRGGGIRTTAGITIDQGTVISNNTAQEGAGLWTNLATSTAFPSGETTTLTKVTITGNSATGTGGANPGGGGGIKVDNSASGNHFVMSFSRLAGNSATAGGSNLFTSNPGADVTATNNWWGINTPATTIGGGATVSCPAPAAGQICFDPFIVLTHTANPAKIRINQSATLTADMSKDNHSNAAALVGNLDVLNTLPITFGNAVLGTIAEAQPEALNAGAQATATYNAGGTGGNGSADATVDQQTVTAQIIVLQPPSITKSFNPTTVAENKPSTITFSITNANTVAINSSFTDNLPANVVVAGTPNVVNGCGGTVTAAAGATSIGFANPTLAVGTCTINVNVQSATDSNYSNSVTIDSADAGNGNTSSANLTVINPPSIAKAFGGAAIPLNGTTNLTFTLTSSNTNLTLNAVAFTDNLPAGLVVATPGNPTTNCSGTVTAADGSSSASLSGSGLAPGASCTVSLNVTGTTAGVKNNSVQATSSNGGNGNTANATITVVAPPTISKAFSAASIPLNGIATLTFTINNPNTTAAGDLTAVAFSDTLPSTTGTLVVAPTPNVTNNCGGTVTATAGTGVISLSGGNVAHNGSCTLSVDVKGTAAGDANNTTGAITSTEGGTGMTSNTATSKIVGPPTISKAFGATAISLNGTTTVSFTITNPAANTAGETGIAFSDTLTGGLQVASTPGVSNTCGGTVTAAANTTTISLTGGSIATPASTCTVVVNVTGTQSGNVSNTTGAVSSTNGGTGATSNTANLIVAGPPTISKAFGALTLPLGGVTSLSFTINNPNTIALSGIAFTDSLPAGLVVNTPNGQTNTCGGTPTAVAGSGSVSLSGGTITAGGSCTVKVDVRSTTAGVKNNTTGNVTSTEGGPGNTASASITVIAPPINLKAFSQHNIALNGTSTMTITIQNPNLTSALTVSFTDNFPAGITVAGTPNLVNGCGGTATAAANATSVSLLNGTVGANSNCTFVVNVTGITVGVWVNSVTVTSGEGGAGNPASDTLTVGPQPTFTKAFSATSVALNGTSTLTFTITNPVGNGITLNNLTFTDTLPVTTTPGTATLVVANPNGLTGNTCSTTPTATAGSGTISLAGASLATGASCTFSVNVTGTVAGDAKNSVTISSTEGGNPGPAANATLTVVAPPSIAKAFNPNTIAVNATTALTFTITNPAANTATENGVALTDTLPANLVVATPNGLSNTCGGTATATAGSGSISLAGGTIATNSSCTLTVNVTSAVAGSYTNTTGGVSSTNGGTGNTATANLTVDAPPAITKNFGAANIPLNGTTSLTFNINNPNATSLTGVSFTDNLPAGLVVATPNGLTNSCGGTPTAVAGSGSVSLAAGTLAGPGSCTLSVNVQGTAPEVANNSVQVTSNEGGPGNTSTASLTIVGPPAISKVFGAASIPLNGSTSLTLTIQNNNTGTALSGVAFSDTLPAGLIISTPNGQTGSCGAGTITATQNTNLISLSGGTIAASSSCTFAVNVTGTAAGLQNNTTGNVTSTEGGTGGTASASVKVEAPPSIAKVFNPLTIALNATTSLQFTITNPAGNVDPLAGVAFADTLPTGLTVANSTSTVCGGTLTLNGSTGIALSGASINTNSQCQFSVTVTGAASGQYTNTTGAVSSTNGGTGNTASANLTVAGPPSITKQFGALTIPLNGTTSLTFNIANPNTTVTLTGLAFTDNLPAGLVVASTPNLNNTCGGTATAVGGSGSISLSGGTLATSASCTVSVNIQGTTAGVKNNSVQVTSNEAGPGSTSNATLTVVAPPVISKAFADASIAPTASTSLSFTVNNPNTSQGLSGVAFTDNLPAGLVVATPNGLSNTCGGTATAAAGSGSVSLLGGTIAASGSCTLSVNVTGTTSGTKNNTTGSVTSTEGGTGNTASATLFVLTPPVIAKAFNPTGISVNGVSTLTITITDPAANGSVALAGVAFTDNFPAGLTVATPNNLVDNCGGTATATAGSTQLALTGGTVAANSSCTVSVNVTSSAAGLYTNTTGPVSSTNAATGNSATANLNVAVLPIINKSFSGDAVALNGTVFVQLSITNPNAFPLTGLTVPDNLPAGMVVATPNGASTDCGGAVTAMPGASSFKLAGGTLAASGSCNVFVNVQDTTPGDKFNTAGPGSSNESGSGAFSNTVGVSVVLPPTVSKSFTPASIPLFGTSTLTFNVGNSNPTTELVNIGLTDVLPAGLVVAAPNGATGSCITTNGAAMIAAPGSSTVTLAALNLLSTGVCSFSVNVTGTHRGHWVNTSGNVTAVFDAGGGNFFAITGGTATAAIDVLAANLTVSKTHSGNFAQRQIGATYTITVGNNGTASTVGTVTLVDTLPSFLTATAIAGANWACDLPSLTCTRSDTLGIGGTYDPITVTVNVAPNTPATVTNTATATGGGDLSPEVANDPTTVTVTGPAIDIIPDPNSKTVVVAAGMAGNFTFTVDAGQINPPPLVITFTCSGLPKGAACIFNPLGEAQPVTQVTMTVTTLGRNNSGALLPFGGDRTPIYAVLLPVLGLVGLAGMNLRRGNKTNKKARLRLAVALIGLGIFLAFAGCGGNPLVTPPGTYPITVTGTASTPSGNVSGTATVTLKVL